MAHFFNIITNIYHKYTHTVKGIYRKKGIRPGADWRVMLLSFFILIFSVACVHIFIYVKVVQGSLWKVDSVNVLPKTTIDKKLLTTVIEKFTTQKEVLEALRVNPTTVADPSL